jgi:arylsulfatase A-like enzyme
MSQTPRCPGGRARPRPRILVVLLLVLWTGGCSRRPPDVLLIVVDTLRADRLGPWGGPPGLTPFMDALAASGVVFTNAYSTSSWTNPAVASLFTSRYPSQHHVSQFDSRLADDEVTLAERLGAGGWRRVGMVANFRLLGQLGFGQGFDAWFPEVAAREPKVRAHRIGQNAIRFYDRQLAPHPWSRWTRHPLLLYLHFMEPHAPYDPPEAVRRARVGAPPAGVDEAAASAKLMDAARWNDLSPPELSYLERLYDGAVAGLDAELVRLFRRLRQRGLLDHTIVVLTADHGEEFDEHGGMQHGTALYEETVHVPLMMAGPGLPAGQVVTDEVSLVDVAPTLLALLGLPPEPRFEGRSLLDRSGSRAHPDGVLLELLPIADRLDLRRHTAGIVRDRLAVLTPGPGGGTDESETFDLSHDPHELRPDPPALAEQGAALRARLAERRADLATRAGVAEIVPLDQATRARLRALGYTTD